MKPFLSLLAAALPLLAAAGPAFAQATAPAPRQIAQFVTIVAEVASVDRARRKVTLVDADGTTEVVAVGPDVEGFDRVQVGDEVEIQYFMDMVTEIREPTAEELETPLRIVDARPEDNPGMSGIRVIHAVVTVEAIDRENLEVTVRGPMGGKRTFPVIYPERLDEVEVGSTAIVTYTEAMAVSLIKR